MSKEREIIYVIYWGHAIFLQNVMVARMERIVQSYVESAWEGNNVTISLVPVWMAVIPDIRKSIVPKVVYIIHHIRMYKSECKYRVILQLYKSFKFQDIFVNPSIHSYVYMLVVDSHW